MDSTLIAAPAELRSALEEILAAADAAADVMDAPADWDSGAVSFDPWV